jgi:hypothetical protein
MPHSLRDIQRIDGERPDVVVDAVIETEHAVWTLVADSAVRDLTDSESMAAIVDAGGWFAGVRHHHCGVIESTARDPSLASVLQARYSRSSGSARLRSATRGPAAPVHARWGGIRWPELAALLEDCRDAANLPAIERALARNAVQWLTSVGIHPSRQESSGGDFRLMK